MAAGSCSGSRPPARASVSRPPPPPPTSAAATLTISPARTPRATSDRRDAGDQIDASVPGAAEHDRGVAQLALEPVGELQQRLTVGHLDGGDEDTGARGLGRVRHQPVDVDRAVGSAGAAGGALQLAHPLRELVDRLGDPVGGDAQLLRRRAPARDHARA